jgi:hypothetical protein
MLINNTKAIVGFLFQELAMPCLLLSQEHCDDLHDRNGKPKVGGGRGPQFQNILKKNLWVGVPMLEGVPHGYLPTPEYTLITDDNPAKISSIPRAMPYSGILGNAIEMTTS